MKECFDITNKAGIKMEPVQGKNIRQLLDYNNKLKQLFAFLIIPIAIKKHRLLRPSMLQDIENGKLCEVDAINGIVCKYGRDLHIPTPYNDWIVEIIHDIEKGKYKPGFQNISLFDHLNK